MKFNSLYDLNADEKVTFKQHNLWDQIFIMLYIKISCHSLIVSNLILEVVFWTPSIWKRRKQHSSTTVCSIKFSSSKWFLAMVCNIMLLWSKCLLFTLSSVHALLNMLFVVYSNALIVYWSWYTILLYL